MASQQELTDERNARFLVLLRPVYQDCQRWAYALAGDQVDAEDVLSDSVLTAVKNLHQLKSDDAFKTWMFRIIRNTYLMQVRSRKQAVESMESADLERQAPGQGGGQEQRERAELVHRALAKLAPEQRQAVELFELHELSIRQVAQVLGKNESAVRVLLHRARHRLAEFLRQAGIAPEYGETN